MKTSRSSSLRERGGTGLLLVSVLLLFLLLLPSSISSTPLLLPPSPPPLTAFLPHPMNKGGGAMLTQLLLPHIPLLVFFPPPPSSPPPLLAPPPLTMVGQLTSTERLHPAGGVQVADWLRCNQLTLSRGRRLRQSIRSSYRSAGTSEMFLGSSPEPGRQEVLQNPEKKHIVTRLFFLLFFPLGCEPCSSASLRMS